MILFSDKMYQRLKFLAQILLPAIGTLYFGLAEIWGLPAAAKVVGTIVVIDTFLGGLLSLSSGAYNKSDARFDGAVRLLGDANEDQRNVGVTLPNADVVEGKDELVLKVLK